MGCNDYIHFTKIAAVLWYNNKSIVMCLNYKCETKVTSLPCESKVVMLIQIECVPSTSMMRNIPVPSRNFFS